MRNVPLCLLPVFLLIGFFVEAQTETIDNELVTKIREEGLQHSQVRYLASHFTDISGPRLTNSPGYMKAAQWAADQLKIWGLTHAGLEPWGDFGYGWSVDKSYVALKSPYYEPLIAYALPWSGSTNGLISGDVYLLEHDDSAYIAKHQANIAHKIILFRTTDTSLSSDFKPFSTRYNDSELVHLHDLYMFTPQELSMILPMIKKNKMIAKMLIKEGAVALLQMTGGRDGTVYVDRIGGYRKSDQPAYPSFAVAKESYLKMQRLLLAGIPVKIEMESNTKFYPDPLKGYNVIAEIPGTDPSLKAQVVMLGGHLDSWAAATGAADNGAGCIASMEAVRILQAVGFHPRRTVRIALWGGEEQGLIGSFNYVRNHFGDPADMQLKPEQKLVSVYFNLDNGSGRIRGIYDQGNTAADTIFSQWMRPIADLGATTVAQHNTGSTDHISFDAVGIPGFQFVQDPLDYETRVHHSNMDSYDHLQMEDLSQAATVIAIFVSQASMRPDMVPRKAQPKPEKFIFHDLTEMP
jgi:hypothetical protein